MNLQLTILSIVIVGVFIATFYYVSKDVDQNLCLADVERRLNYIERKLCNPYSTQACEIDPTLQADFDNWKQEEINKCN